MISLPLSIYYTLSIFSSLLSSFSFPFHLYTHTHISTLKTSDINLTSLSLSLCFSLSLFLSLSVSLSVCSWEELWRVMMPYFDVVCHRHIIECNYDRMSESNLFMLSNCIYIYHYVPVLHISSQLRLLLIGHGFTL